MIETAVTGPDDCAQKVAERTGFSAPTLRYYEAIGLVKAGRTRSGYRVYDERDLERLRFIGQAKRLGLQLDQLRELMAIWDAEDCGPVHQRLRELVRSELSRTRRAVEELDAFAAQLEAIAGRLTDQAPRSGPCGDGCACDVAGSGGPPVVSIGVGEPPVEPSEVPIACTLRADQLPDRMGQWQELVAEAVERRDLSDGIVLRFPPGSELAARVSQLALAEQDCCRFFEFTIRVAPSGTELEVRAPDSAKDLVDELMRADA